MLSQWSRVAICGGLFAAAAAVVMITTQRVYNYTERTDLDARDEKTRYVFAGTLAVGAMLWPVVWEVCIGMNTLMRQKNLMLGFLFPLFMAAVELGVITQRTSRESKSQSLFAHHELNSDASAIISAAFAMGSLFLRARNPTATHIIMYGLLLCITFVVPTISVEPDSRTAVLLRSGQKVLLSYSLGFVITGISMDLVQPIFDHAGTQLLPSSK